MTDHRLWPGKTLHPNPAGPSWHPATFHCLDVAAVAERLLVANPAWCDRIARAFGGDRNATVRLLVRLVALHDIGKLTLGFCEMLDHEPPVPARHRRTPLRHWQSSYWLLLGALDDGVARLLGLETRGARRQMYAAVAGHHGRPPDESRTPRFSDIDGVPDALQFIDDLAELVPGLDTWSLDVADASRLSWTVAGLTVLADWIGSNTTWFPYARHDTSVEVYWQTARSCAERAVRAAGVDGSRIAPSASLYSLFGIATPRPMQSAAAALAIGRGPMMAVIEDATGSGKTEAAVLLAQRLMASGHAEGVYVALPTMATANAMFARLGDGYRRLFDADQRPSLALAHGARDLNADFNLAVEAGLVAARGESATEASGSGSIDATSVSAFCSAWIADNRRKTFTAEVGVGTIDQAFLGILPVRFAVLRLVGLARRVLIIDEAHACDPYMEAELCRLLEMQAVLGGSAIVMTATLTHALREKLVAAYRRGLGVEKNDFAPHALYPSLTVARADTDKCVDFAVEPCAQTTRSLPVERLDTTDDAIALIVERVRRGAAVAWVRNTVDDVIDGHDRLAAALDSINGCEVELFHARFAMGDRLDIERDVLSRFGRESAPTQRAGRVLVASQVIEASLDLDFDVMVSDLAPVDALIQRAGRLWRHMDLRPAAGRPVSAPVLHVLSPDPDLVEDDGWGRPQFGGSGFVYGSSVLWRSARAVFDVGRIDAPDGLRPLLEAVVGDAQPELPEPLERGEDLLLGRDYAAAARSRANAVEPSLGYLSSAVQGTDVSFPTRADTDSCKAVLVCRVADVLVPWIDTDATTTLSEIGLRQYRYDKIVEAGGAPKDEGVPGFASDWPDWRRESLKMLLVEADGRVGDRARYDRVRGLHNVPELAGQAPPG